MRTKKLHIKNMVCPRCIASVKNGLEELGLSPCTVVLGEAEIHEDANVDMDAIRSMLLNNGFELLENKSVQIISQIKTRLIDLIYNRKLTSFEETLSGYLSKNIGKDYSFLSHLFSSTEGVTIERYFILQKVERVKELLIYDELSLKEISVELGYSSPAHLSGQFKNITGLTPSAFKNSNDRNRNTLDAIR